jgi:tetratricopeptide (TPR) repeat protein
MQNNTSMDSILTLLEKSARARAAKNWGELEDVSIQLLRMIKGESRFEVSDLKTTVRNYLSAIIGSGSFLTELNNTDSAKFREGLDKLLTFVKSTPHKFESVQNTLISAQEIILLSLDPIVANRNKIAKNLREIARPDLSIIICNQILDQSRLNYYSLTILCGALCDLGDVDTAIIRAEDALKYSPDNQKSYPLNALVRAHTLKFKSTGDISEIEKALEYGHTSIDIKIDIFVANAFVAAAIASTDSQEIEIAREVLSKAEPQLRTADIAALFQAYQAEQALAPASMVVESIDEATDDYFAIFDSLFDLVVRDEGFVPIVLDLRNMQQRFASDGWFLQGLSNIPCPTCHSISLHSYRKHFNRYGKDMHYWALVCDTCKSATDSIDYDKKEFTFISSDLEENFPVAMICSDCQ